MKTSLSLVMMLLFVASLHAQDVRATHRTENKQVFIKARKIQSVVTIDGNFHEGKANVSTAGIVFRSGVVPFDQIGILEARKLTGKEVASLPLKLVGIVTGGAGLIMTSAYIADEDVNDGVGIAGLALTGVGIGALYLGKKSSTQSKDDKVKSFHVKDWTFTME